MQLQDTLFSQGFGTRRICAGLIQQGLVKVGGETVTDPAEDFDEHALAFEVEGAPWRFHERAYLMVNKPTGVECSAKPSAYASIYTLLPAPLRQRPQKGGAVGVQPVGRLDQDTTGLLLMTDDGQFIHRMNSPKHHVPKVYDVTTKHEFDDKFIAKLLAGVVLDDDPGPVRAAACERLGERLLALTLTEGKYHQVKRMIAAAGNRVEALHRSRIGTLHLPEDLAPGQWRWLEDEQLQSLRQPVRPA